MKLGSRQFFLFVLIFELISCGSDDVKSNCELLPDIGNCDAAIIRYYYDQNASECREFLWGGCGGLVPFETLEECQSCEDK